MSDRSAEQPLDEDLRSAPHERAAAHLFERAAEDAVEPALLQSGNPPRVFEEERTG
jgi:hypothetical protein